ncbi:MerR family transcriptional regulator [Bacillus thuringiensis]|uniref:MerR family transcriptional regulator n=1 Tax=Bacillus thuringiensis TaxID=1428 RepID=UPI003988A032
MSCIFKISDFTKKNGLSTDTIRYYEKINLLPPANRNGNNNRHYVQIDINRILFINYLKRTQMPLHTIQIYMEFSRARFIILYLFFVLCYAITTNRRYEK